MKRRSLVLAYLILAACGRDAGEDEGANAGNRVASSNATQGTPEKAAPARAGAPSVKPGMWETTTEMLEMKMEGAPAAAMAGFKPSRTVTRHCVTPAEASAAAPDFGEPEGDGRCDIQKRSWSGGTIDIAMTCTGPGAEGRMNIRSTGRYDATSFTMDNESVMTGPNGMRMNSRMRISGRRTGDCAG